jgi:TolB-like protein/DNA-binding SARP family transcriptional activator/cytochrome c-type biogenesis protein CcmH/NrfG
VAYFWPESDTEKSRHLLSDSIYRVNQALGGEVIVAWTDQLRIDPALLSSDVADFEAALDRGDLAAGIRLYRGPFLDGFFLEGSSEFERWVEGERERLSQAYGAALESLAEAAGRRGEHREALALWRRLAGLDPFSSRVALRLVEALIGSGDRAAALQQARLHEALLREEWGAGPADEFARAATVIGTGPEPVRAPPRLPEGEGMPEPPAKPNPAAVAIPAKSIAVLYFENMGSEAESDYFCAGITEDIITDLSSLGALRVVSRSDVLPFRNKAINARQVGDALRVHYILQGSVRKAGKRIRITAQLLDVRDGYHLWAERFDGLVEDIFDVQNEVAQKIAGALKDSLTETEKASLARKPTDDLRAYDFYMQGRECLNRRGRKPTETAIRMFESALAIDPNFAAAFAGLGEACAVMYEWYDGKSLWLARAIDMNQEALSRDPESVDVQFGIAMVYYHQGRLEKARRGFLAVLEADPRHFPACLRLGMLAERSPGGDARAALNYYRRASELRPHDDDPWRFLAGLHRRLGDADAANEAAINVIEMTGRKLEASLEDVVLLSRLAEAYARFGGKEETHAILKRVFELDPSDGLALYNCACAYALLREGVSARLCLRRAFDSGFGAVGHGLSADGAFDAIRHDPEFQALIAELE